MGKTTYTNHFERGSSIPPTHWTQGSGSNDDESCQRNMLLARNVKKIGTDKNNLHILL
jgi:hypothetical protein